MSAEKLFVAGVSWSTTDDAFKTCFAQFGDVEAALIMREAGSGRSRGFGFVTYKDPAVAEKVLAQALQLDGRKLDIKRAIPKEAMAQRTKPANTKKLYVAGISFDATDEALAKYFLRFGQVEKATVMKDRASGRSRGFGFVTFADGATAADVLARHAAAKLEWEGRTLELQSAIPKGSPLFLGGPGPTKVYVAGLSHSTTDESLRAYFSTFGTVSDASVQRSRNSQESRGFGFVTFASPASVDKVLAFQGHSVDGQQVDCKVAVPKANALPPMYGMVPWNWPGMPMYGRRGGWEAMRAPGSQVMMGSQAFGRFPMGFPPGRALYPNTFPTPAPATDAFRENRGFAGPTPKFDQRSSAADAYTFNFYRDEYGYDRSRNRPNFHQ